MEPSWMLHAGMAFAVIGLFAAAWFRYHRPVHLKDGHRTRVEPGLERSQEAGDAGVPSRSETRREPQV